MLSPTFSWPTRAELREMLAIAAPVVVVQVGLQVMGFVDTLMVGRLSADALAGVALGNFYFFNIAIFGMGTLMALDPVVAQALGAGMWRSAPSAFRRSSSSWCCDNRCKPCWWCVRSCLPSWSPTR